MGSRWAVVNLANRRVGVVETTEFRIRTFADVGWDSIVDAGEGKQRVEKWQEN